jgi:hypothetical protein
MACLHPNDQFGIDSGGSKLSMGTIAGTMGTISAESNPAKGLIQLYLYENNGLDVVIWRRDRDSRHSF